MGKRPGRNGDGRGHGKIRKPAAGIAGGMEMKVAERIVVAGGSLAGLRAIESLREEGHEGEIVALCGEAEMPYDRPPLSKKFLRSGRIGYVGDIQRKTTTCRRGLALILK